MRDGRARERMSRMETAPRRACRLCTETDRDRRRCIVTASSNVHSCCRPGVLCDKDESDCTTPHGTPPPRCCADADRIVVVSVGLLNTRQHAGGALHGSLAAAHRQSTGPRLRRWTAERRPARPGGPAAAALVPARRRHRRSVPDRAATVAAGGRPAAPAAAAAPASGAGAGRQDGDGEILVAVRQRSAVAGASGGSRDWSSVPGETGDAAHPLGADRRRSADARQSVGDDRARHAGPPGARRGAGGRQRRQRGSGAGQSAPASRRRTRSTPDERVYGLVEGSTTQNRSGDDDDIIHLHATPSLALHAIPYTQRQRADAMGSLVPRQFPMLNINVFFK